MAREHPIWQTLNEQGRSNVWLAKRTGYSYGYVRMVACGAAPVTEEFRHRAAMALGVPETLFDTNEHSAA